MAFHFNYNSVRSTVPIWRLETLLQPRFVRNQYHEEQSPKGVYIFSRENPSALIQIDKTRIQVDVGELPIPEGQYVLSHIIDTFKPDSFYSDGWETWKNRPNSGKQPDWKLYDFRDVPYVSPEPKPPLSLKKV